MILGEILNMRGMLVVLVAGLLGVVGLLNSETNKSLPVRRVWEDLNDMFLG